MAKEKTYSEKLKDPRWQKKRLEIFQRDEWTCQACFSTEKMLCVHHFDYESKENPWEVSDKALITCCGDCHDIVHTGDYDTAQQTFLKLLFAMFVRTEGHKYKEAEVSDGK